MSISLSSLKQEAKQTLNVSIPLIASGLVYSSTGFLGTAMVARLGEDALAASVLVTTLWMAFSVFFFGLFNAVGALVAHQYGAKNNRAISILMGQSYLLGAIVIVFMMILLGFMHLLLPYSGQPETVQTLAKTYLHAMLWQIPGLIILIISEQFCAGINRTKLVLRISMIIVPIEIPLMYILIFGKLGLPAFGIAGIGYGFAITYTVTAIGMLIYLHRSASFKPFAIFQHINKLHFSYFKELIKVGMPIGFMHLIEVSTFTIATFWIARFSTTMLAAHQIVFQFFGFFITFIFSVSQAATIRVGHEVGTENISAARYASYVGTFISLFVIILLALAFYYIPAYFLRLDFNIHDPANANLLRDASTLLIISGVMMIFDNIRIIGFGALRGLKDTRFPMYASFIGFWLIGLSCAYLFAFYLHLEAPGIWWGLTVGIVAGAVLIQLRLWYLLKNLDITKLIKIKTISH